MLIIRGASKNHPQTSQTTTKHHKTIPTNQPTKPPNKQKHPKQTKSPTQKPQRTSWITPELGKLACLLKLSQCSEGTPSWGRASVLKPDVWGAHSAGTCDLVFTWISLSFSFLLCMLSAVIFSSYDVHQLLFETVRLISHSLSVFF